MLSRPAKRTIVAASPRPSGRGLVLPVPLPMALEQRFMFDGAAAVDAVSTVAHTDAVLGGGLLHFAGTTESLPAALNAAQQQAEKAAIDFLLQPNAKQQLFAMFDGGQSEASVAWQAAAEQLVADAREGKLSVQVELRSGAELQGALAAFAAAGADGKPVIYFNRDWVQTGTSTEAMSRVLIEEMGHAIDQRLNAGEDTAGDEGELFTAAVTGVLLSV
jgi:hypothetical protein